MGWVQVVLFVLSIAIAYSSRPKPVKPPKAVQDDFDFPQVDEGTTQAVYFGECWVNSWCVIGLGNFRQTPIYKPPGADAEITFDITEIGDGWSE